jgi:hypothetical protein
MTDETTEILCAIAPLIDSGDVDFDTHAKMWRFTPTGIKVFYRAVTAEIEQKDATDIVREYRALKHCNIHTGFAHNCANCHSLNPSAQRRQT